MRFYGGFKILLAGFVLFVSTFCFAFILGFRIKTVLYDQTADRIARKVSEQLQLDCQSMVINLMDKGWKK